MPPWEKYQSGPWDKFGTNGAVRANEVLDTGVQNMVPSETTSVLTPEDIEMENATAYYSNKYGTNMPPDLVMSNIKYEYGDHATPATANQQNKRAGDFVKGMFEYTGKLLTGAAANMPKLRQEMSQFRDESVRSIVDSFGLDKQKSDALYATVPMTPFDWANKAWTMVPADKLQQWGAEKVREAGEVQSEYMSGVPLEELLRKGDFDTAGKDIGTAIAFEAPSMAIQIAMGLVSPEASLEMMFARSAGAKRAEKTEDDTLTERVVAPIAVGAVEVATEKLLGTQRIIDSMAKRKIAAGMSNRFRQILTDITGGGLSEGGATFGENVVDRLSGEEGKLTEGVLMSTIVGSVMDTAAGRVMTLGDAVRTRKQNTDEQIVEIVENDPYLSATPEIKAQAIETLTNPTDENVGALNDFLPDMDQEAAQIMQEEGERRQRAKEQEAAEVREAPEVGEKVGEEVRDGTPQEEDVVGFSTKAMNEARLERGEQELTEEEAESHRKTMEEALEAGQNNKADALAERIMKTADSRNPMQVNRHEAAGMGARIVELRNERIALAAEMRQAIEAKDEAAKKDITDRTEQNADKARFIEDALKIAERESGRATSMMASWVNRFTYDVVSLMDEARLAKGDNLTTEEAADIDDVAKKIEDINRQIKELEEKLLKGEITPDMLGRGKKKKKIEPKELRDARATLHQLEREARNKIYNLRRKSARDWFKEAATLPRTLMATADMSYALRQGVLPSLGHPVLAAKTFGTAFKSFFSQNTADEADVYMRRQPLFDETLRLGTHYNSMDSAIDNRTEFFASNLAEKIPGFGAVVRASERNMVTGINLLRYGLMSDFIMKHPGATEVEKRAYARYVNAATGRGSAKMLDKAAEELSIVFFAPRFAWSRIQAPVLAVENTIIHPSLRKEMARQWAAFLGTGIAILALAKMMGADVGLDPDEADFGKIIIGKKRIDIWGGVQQPFRLLAKAIKAGVEYRQEGETDVEIMQDLETFLEYKWSPVVRMIPELATGRTAGGYPVEPLEIGDMEVQKDAAVFVRNMTPLIVQSAIEAYNEGEDPAVVAALVAGEGLGLSIQVYDRD